MIPGLTTKLSEEAIGLATTISPRSDIVRVTSTTSTTVLQTITPAFGGGFGGMIMLINESGANMTTVTTGNIMAARTIPVNMPIPFVFSKVANKWYPGAIS